MFFPFFSIKTASPSLCFWSQRSLGTASALNIACNYGLRQQPSVHSAASPPDFQGSTYRAGGETGISQALWEPYIMLLFYIHPLLGQSVDVWDDPGPGTTKHPLGHGGWWHSHFWGRGLPKASPARCKQPSLNFAASTSEKKCQQTGSLGMNFQILIHEPN